MKKVRDDQATHLRGTLGNVAMPVQHLSPEISQSVHVRLGHTPVIMEHGRADIGGSSGKPASSIRTVGPCTVIRLAETQGLER